MILAFVLVGKRPRLWAGPLNGVWMGARDAPLHRAGRPLGTLIGGFKAAVEQGYMKSALVASHAERRGRNVATVATASCSGVS